MNMKKAAAGILTAAVILSAGATSALAAGHGRGRNFTDTNGDGICDHAASSCRYEDENQDGVCDLRMNRTCEGHAHSQRNGCRRNCR